MSFITIAGLGWRTPDNEPLFSDLSLTFGAERTGLVGKNGTGKTTLLRLLAGDLVPMSGSITTPPSVGFLPQDTERLAENTLADLFGVHDQLALLARAAHGEASADELADADWALEVRLESALTGMGLDQPLETRLGALSGGQRTRAALAALMFAGHDALLLDEPTNHLDRAGRRYVMDALRAWRGCVIVASHDRTLLGEMDAIVELTSLGARTYGGNYHAYRAAKDAELALAQGKLVRAEQALSDTRARAQLAAERKARSDRQGRRLRVSGSQPKLVMNAAKERSEGSGSSAARLRNRQAEEAEAALANARSVIDVQEPLVMDIPSSGLVPGRNVLEVDDLRFGYPGGPAVLESISFSIRGPERVAIVGANGAGKSTLLACILGRLQPQAGTVSVQVPAALVDQDLSVFDAVETVREAFARLDPTATENHRRAALARFLFRGDAVQQKIGSLSGGERMRAALACTLGHSRPPQLLLLDEPSNHLDIEAVETLEAALIAFDGAVLAVSHDQTFLDRIGVTRRIVL